MSKAKKVIKAKNEMVNVEQPLSNVDKFNTFITNLHGLSDCLYEFNTKIFGDDAMELKFHRQVQAECLSEIFEDGAEYINDLVNNINQNIDCFTEILFGVQFADTVAETTLTDNALTDFTAVLEQLEKTLDRIRVRHARFFGNDDDPSENSEMFDTLNVSSLFTIFDGYMESLATAKSSIDILSASVFGK